MGLYIGNVKIADTVQETKAITLTYSQYQQLSADQQLCSDYYYMTTDDNAPADA